MKKTIITLALVAVSAFALMSTNVMAHGNRGSRGYGMMGGHGMMGGGYCGTGGYGMMGNGYPMMGRGCGMMNGYYQGDTDDAAYLSFQKDTADLRADLAADVAELNAVMAGADPDAKRARALSESISAKQNQLAEAARKNNIQTYGNGWNGQYCNRW